MPNGAPERPYVDERVPRGALTPAEAYAAGMAARKAGKLPKVNTPVAGGPGPSIPRLDGVPSQPGMTMQQHAQMARAAEQAQLPTPAEGGSFVEPPPSASPVRKTAPQLGLLPLDVLPEQAREDPEFREGHASMFAVNQPNLAMKYGVVRNGQVLTPQQLANPRGESRKLRPETINDLKKIQELQKARDNVPLPEGSPSEEISDAAKAAATVGNVPGDASEKPLTPGERKEVEKTLSRLDEFQFDAWRQAMMKDILNNPEQQKIIEERLETMDVGDMITNGFIIQRVPVLPNKFEVSFKTTDGETDLALKRLIMEDANTIGELTDRYYLDRFALMSVAASLYAINNKVFPEHRDAKGDFNDDLFRKKFNLVLKLPFHMLASIGLNAMWFEQRVRGLFKAEKLSNG